MTVEHQRERHHADAEGDEGKQEADAATDHDQPPALWGGEHARHEVANAGGALIAEHRDVDGLRGGDPSHEQSEQQGAKPEHGTEGRRAQNVESIPSGCFLARFAPAAEFVEGQCSERTDQGKTSRQRKQQRQHGCAKHAARQDQSEHRIDHAKEEGVARHCLEVFPTFPQRLVQVGKADLADGGFGRTVLAWLDL